MPAPQPNPGAEQLATVLLSHPDPLPAPLVSAIARRAHGRNVTLLLAARPELTPADADLADAALDPRFTPGDLRARLLARQQVRDHVALDTRIKAICSSGTQRTSTAEVVAYAMSNPYVRPELLELFATSTDPVIVATYAHTLRSGPADRSAALTRLERLLGPEARRVTPAAADHGARALELLMAEDPEGLGRAQLLNTRTRAVLLALAADAEPWVVTHKIFEHLDAATRAHLVREAVLPVLCAAKSTHKDTLAAEGLVRGIMRDLDLDVLRYLAPFVPALIKRDVAAEIRRRSDESFALAHQSLREFVAAATEHDRTAAAVWIMGTLAQAGSDIGWEATLTLADQMPAETTLEQMRDTVAGVAAPIEHRATAS